MVAPACIMIVLLCACRTSSSEVSVFRVDDEGRISEGRQSDRSEFVDERVLRAQRLAVSNQALHRLNDHIINRLDGGQNEVVCISCIILVLAAADVLGNQLVKRQIKDALRSDELAEFGNALFGALQYDDTLNGLFRSYYSADALPQCVTIQDRATKQRCETQRHYMTSNGRVIDFRRVDAKDEINREIELSTDGAIQQLFTQLPHDTSLVFASTLVFKANWPSQMATRPGNFTALAENGQTSQQQVTMLIKEEYLPVIEDTHARVQGVALPYASGHVKMFIFKSTDSQTDIRKVLHDKHLKELNKAPDEYVFIEFPQFDISSKKHLYQDVLASMGITEMFIGGLGYDDHLKVDQLAHRAEIKTDQDGTFAAGAAGIAFVPLSAKPIPKIMLFDREFIVVLYHTKLDVPLFTTFIANPNKQ